MRATLAMFSFYRRFIPGFSQIAEPIIRLTKGHTGKGDKIPVEWSEECQKALNTLKDLVKKDVILAYPDFTKPFQVHTDASEYAIGATISQSGRPLCFQSKLLNPAERNYSVIEKRVYGDNMVLKV